MQQKTKVLIVGAALAAASIPAIAQAGGDSATPTPGTDLEKAATGAVQEDGSQMDVQLDETLNVVGTEDEAGNDDSAAGKEDDAEGNEEDESTSKDSDSPIPSPEIDRASAVAIEYLGGGTITATEIDDEESYYEVEVTMADGRQVDVQLDQAFNVVGTEDEGPEDDSAGG